MLRDSVISDLRSLRPANFVEKHFFGEKTHVLPDPATFEEWKSTLCAGLDVEPTSAYLVGSAALGVSLNPFKNFKLFDAASDLDVAVVSSDHFEIAWKYLRENGRIRRDLLGKERAAWDSHVNGLIFWGAVEADKLLALYPFGLRWLTALTAASTDAIGLRPVKARIYKDFEALRDYQIQGARKLQSDLAARGADDA